MGGGGDGDDGSGGGGGGGGGDGGGGGGAGGDGGDRSEDVGTPTLPQLGRTDASRRMTRNSGAIPVVVMAAIDSSV